MFPFDCRRPRMETHLQIEAFDDAGAVAIILVPTAGSHLVHVVVVVFIVIGMQCSKLQESRRRRKGRRMSKKMEVGPRRRGFGGNNVRVLWISQLLPNQVSRSLNSHSKKYLRHYLHRVFNSLQVPRYPNNTKSCRYPIPIKLPAAKRPNAIASIERPSTAPSMLIGNNRP